MKKFNLILIVALNIVFISSGCTNSIPEQPKAQIETITNQDHQENEKTEPIELNNNEKWLVNNEMKPFLKTGLTLVDEYTTSSKTDYNALAIQLKEQNKQLVTSCTMKGKSHDELHKWLAPHLKLVADLEKANNEAEAKELIVKLKESYTLYNQYFQ